MFILSFKLRGEKGKHLARIMFKHNLANTASAIEKWPFGNSAPNRIFYIISKRLFFALAKTAKSRHYLHTTASARQRYTPWATWPNLRIATRRIAACRSLTPFLQKTNLQKFASGETPMTEIMAAVCPHPLKIWRYWVCYLGIAILFWKLVTEEFFSNVLMF